MRDWMPSESDDVERFIDAFSVGGCPYLGNLRDALFRHWIAHLASPAPAPAPAPPTVARYLLAIRDDLSEHPDLVACADGRGIDVDPDGLFGVEARLTWRDYWAQTDRDASLLSSGCDDDLDLVNPDRHEAY